MGGVRQAGPQKVTLDPKKSSWFWAGTLMQEQEPHPWKQEESLTFLSIL